MFKQLIVIITSIAILGCNKKDIIARMDINTQADIDYICDNLPEGDTFVGAIIATTDIELDFKCLKNLRHIEGTVIIEGPKTTEAFKNLESVVGGEVFAICDNAVDTMSFPNLKTVEPDLSMSSFCSFDNVLDIPNVEILTNLSISSPAFTSTGMREGTLIGFNKLEDIYDIDLDIDFSNEYFKIDGFSNLKKVNGTFKISAIGSSFDMSEHSFLNLSDINEGKIYKNFDADESVRLVNILPTLKSCNNLEIYNFEPSDACYLKEYIQSGEISIQMSNTFTNEYFDSESLLELCN